MKVIYFIVNNDITYDRRMFRICNSLSEAGYRITLVGVNLPASVSLTKTTFSQKRLNCVFKRGKLFYTEFNIRILFYLLSRKMDAICAIDLDTIIPCFFIAKLKRIKKIYDAHELFTEMKEVLSRPLVKKMWDYIEKKTVPHFENGYTVSQSIAEELKKRYHVHYGVILNTPVLKQEPRQSDDSKKFILYQGAVNEARGLEFLIPTMRFVDCQLIICGDGNIMKQTKELVARYSLNDKVIFLGMLPPDELSVITGKAYIGVNLVENYGLNQYYSLANKFFDYMHACVPQITMDFPEYKAINEKFRISALISDLNVETIAATLNNL